MKNYIQSWRSSILSESNPLLLSEGLFDIGLPAAVAESINRNFEGVPEKGKTMLGNIFKNTYLFHLDYKYYRPLLNDIKDFIEEIEKFVLDFIATIPKDERDEEDIKKTFLFLRNIRNQVLGARSQAAEPATWTAKITDVQKILKDTKKAFTTGLFAKMSDEPPDKAYVEMFESLASDIYDHYAQSIGDMTLDTQVWLKSHPDEYKKIPKLIPSDGLYTIRNLLIYADKWVKDFETEEQKIHTFDDTSYWYDLKTDSCSVEAERMGHCGGDTRAATLYSLRYKNKREQKSRSYVTVAYNPDTGSIYQIKGKFNKAPEKKFYEHIAWLINALGNPQVFETGDHSDDFEGFVKMSEWLRKNTDAKIDEPTDAWDEMRDLVLATMNAYNEDYFYSKIFVEMADPHVADEPSYYFRGYVGVPIELEELSEEGQQKLKDNKFTRDEVMEISRLMDDSRASGRFTGTIGPPPIVEGDYAIFFFYASDLITSGNSNAEWSLSSYDGDIRMFARDILDMDRDASVSGNKLQRDLIRALIATGFMDGGPFLNLFMGARGGELQEDSDWVVETDVDDDDNPKLVWIQTPIIYFNLSRLERDGVSEEYYRKPQVVGKILNSNAFKEAFMNILSANAMVSDTIFPTIQNWDVDFGDYKSPIYALELAWSVNNDSNERIADVVSYWLNAEYGKSDFEQMLHIAYYRTLNAAFEADAVSNQASMDFPGGKRLSVNESVSHKDIIRKWKGFKGF